MKQNETDPWPEWSTLMLIVCWLDSHVCLKFQQMQGPWSLGRIYSLLSQMN